MRVTYIEILGPTELYYAVYKPPAEISVLVL